jgi:hypothetical protein
MRYLSELTGASTTADSLCSSRDFRRYLGNWQDCGQLAAMFDSINKMTTIQG